MGIDSECVFALAGQREYRSLDEQSLECQPGLRVFLTAFI